MSVKQAETGEGKGSRVHGALAEFESPEALLKAAEAVRGAGYSDFDCHSPYPIHGMDDAMGEKRSILSWIVAGAAITGFAVGLGLQWWTSAIEYPLILAGKVFFSYQAFFPITFSLTVLFSAVAAVLGMVYLIRQRFHHPVFYSENFGKFSDDGFFVSVLADDARFNRTETVRFLQSIGGKNIELLEDK